MRFDVTFWSRTGAPGSDATGCSAQEVKRTRDGRQNIADKQQHTGQHAQHGGSGISPIALTFDSLLRRGLGIIISHSTSTKQRSQVISQGL
jgi:hypothetical protein